MMSVRDQIEAARREVRKAAKTVPHIFPEWQTLQMRKWEFQQAKKRLDEAKAAWDRVLKGDHHD